VIAKEPPLHVLKDFMFTKLFVLQSSLRQNTAIPLCKTRTVYVKHAALRKTRAVYVKHAALRKTRGVYVKHEPFM